MPAFITGGLHDIFQRGEPLLYEQLKDQVNAKLLVGNWTHGNFGSDLLQEGVPSLDQIVLCWFDHYLKGIDADVEAIPRVTPYILGEDWIKTPRAGGFLICVKKKMFFPRRGTQNGLLFRINHIRATMYGIGEGGSTLNKNRLKLLSLLIALTLFYIQNQETDTAYAEPVEDPPIESVKESAKKMARSLVIPGE